MCFQIYFICYGIKEIPKKRNTLNSKDLIRIIIMATIICPTPLPQYILFAEESFIRHLRGVHHVIGTCMRQ